MTNLVVLEILVHLLDASVDEGSLVAARHSELLLTPEGGGREQHVLGKGKNTITLNNLGGAFSLANLLSDGVLGVK